MHDEPFNPEKSASVSVLLNNRKQGAIESIFEFLQQHYSWQVHHKNLVHLEIK